ncbi:hypothetical protein EW145_g5628 [Phellinidium pouzarii]|uniref:Uncharacterized protein n=1 Tax=Phellinidium pouzarii TaxID=167371 RepID=A0A4S4KZC2_9AGAM|nr:hypothetical protein EW145_g5628 [Phellinidium pouzarii]
MAKYFAVNWVYWKSDLDRDHAHEMMTRVLLDHIVRIVKESTDVTIDMKNRRPYPEHPLILAGIFPRRTSKDREYRYDVFAWKSGQE